MSRILNVASALSLVLTTGAALAVTDVSFATEAADDVPETEIYVDAEVLEEQETGETPEIIFAGPEEVVQDIPEEVYQEDAEANAAAEAVDGFNGTNAGSLRELVAAQDTSGSLSEEMHCLAGTIYFESKSESLDGQLAVARVVMARADSHRFPNSICGVVYQRKQFSFVRGGRMPRINKGHRQWRNAVAIAKIAMNDAWKSPVEGALFFHARYVNPRWRLTRMASVGNHIFYR